jgi:transcriptional regulator with XRE-family HTH domain
MQRYPHFEAVLGEEIAKARTAAGLSQRALSEKIRRRFNYISIIESGRQSLTVSGLSEIALALGVKGSELHARAERAAGLRPFRAK